MIHRLTEIHADCHLGVAVTVWQFASVLRGATVGARSVVGACAVLDACIVGPDCRIGAGAQLHPGTLVGAGVFIGPGVIACNDRFPRVARGSWHIPALPAEATVTVEDGASIGAGAVLLPGVRIGAGAAVAAGERVARPVPARHLLLRGKLRPIDDADEALRLVFAC